MKKKRKQNKGNKRNGRVLKWILVILVVIMLIGMFNKTNQKPNGYLNTIANFRSSISMSDTAIIQKYEAGTLVYIIDNNIIDDIKNTGHKWRKVKIDGKVGYVVAEYVDEFDMNRLGIDISYANKKLFPNSEKLTAFLQDRQIGFGLIRIGARTQGSKRIILKDYMADVYMDAFEEAKVPFGVYWFFDARSEKEAKEEAKVIAECMKKCKKYSYMKIPLFLDIECNVISTSEYIRYAEITIAEVKKQTGIDEIGIYMGASKCSMVKNQIKDYPLWLAHYDYSIRWLPKHFYNSNEYNLADAENLMIWQFTDKPNAFTKLGIDLDLDYASEKFVEAYLK